MEGKTYWLISAPKTNEDTFNTLNKKTTDEQELSLNYKFQVPELKIGTLDSLLALSDDLVKMDNYVENIMRKIATQLFDVLDAKADKAESLTVNNNSIDTYLTFFRWDEAKYPHDESLKTLSETIHSQVAKLDEELRAKATDYNNLTHSLNQEERKAGGNLTTRELSDIIKQEHIPVSSEYMETLFVVVPKFLYEEWQTKYEKLTPFVIPRSSTLIKEDGEYGVWNVALFRKVSEDFKNACREKRFVVREFSYDPDRKDKSDKKKLEAEKQKQKTGLVRWCKTNFSEAFVGWVHMKAIRVFVESVLRYGLPTNFQAMLILPQKSKVKRLRKVLNELYGHLSSKSVFSKEDEDEGPPGSDKFFPYVFLEISIDFRKQGTF